MFLGKLENARWAVPLLIPVSAMIPRHERPCARMAATLSAPTGFRGRGGGFLRIYRSRVSSRVRASVLASRYLTITGV
jgi:hypothetical protein